MFGHYATATTGCEWCDPSGDESTDQVGSPRVPFENLTWQRWKIIRHHRLFFSGKIHLEQIFKWLYSFFPLSCLFPGSIFVIILACETVFF